MKPIDIVLATYNGEKFIAEQLASIQSSTDYESLINELIIIDDGSTDKTAFIVHNFMKNDSKIRWIPCSGPSLGASLNFSKGVSFTTAPNVMFCDQDDIWLPEKIKLSYQQIISLNEKPGLVFSDVFIVSENLDIISRSYFEIKKLPKNWSHSFDNLLRQNVASGCTMLFNRALLNLAFPIPEDAYMHDWWLILIAKLHGEVVFIDEPLVKYRQHGNNTIGISETRKYNFLVRLKKFRESLNAVIIQSKTLKDLPLNKNINLKSLDILSSIPEQKIFMRLYYFSKGYYRRNTTLGCVAMLFCILFLIKRAR